MELIRPNPIALDIVILCYFIRLFDLCVWNFIDPLQARLSTFLRVFYTELALKDLTIPQWAHATAPGALCPARLEPDFRLHSQSHGFSDPLTVDQLLTPIQVNEKHSIPSGR